MNKAERKTLPPETPSTTSAPVGGSMLDGLNVKSKSSDKKPKKTKKDGSPTWHQLHRTYRYYIEDSIYKSVAGIATTLNVESVSAVATTLMSFALDMYDCRKVSMESHPNPNPKSTKMTLIWTHKQDGWERDIKPDAGRKQRRLKPLIREKEKVPTYGFRWPQEFHTRIQRIATQYDVPIGAVVTRLLAYSTEEWHAGRLTVDTQPVVTNDISGWGAK